jgi:hypothetical protein
MIQIDRTLISDEVFEKKFVCDLSACKGACCVEGESGAPLDEDELEKLEQVYDEVVPFMRQEGVDAIAEQGLFVLDWDGDYTTPLVDGAECAYVTFDERGIAKCAIDTAYRAGKIDWQKPISCHLYPIRITKLKDFDALNYHHWPICEPACSCGDKLDVRVFKFLKEPLIRKYGEEWYKDLEAAFDHWSE